MSIFTVAQSKNNDFKSYNYNSDSDDITNDWRSPGGSGLERVFVAVHSGAGNHSKANEDHNKKICKAACMQAMKLMKGRNNAADAATAAVMSLEDVASTNAGYGSNLNFEGDVECEAGVMDGASLCFGAVGALSGVKNPVKGARLLVHEQIIGGLPCGMVSPSLFPSSVLVGKGAKMFCAIRDMDTTYNLISKSAFKTYSRYSRKYHLFDTKDIRKKRKVDSDVIVEEYHGSTSKAGENGAIPTYNEIQDTVGAICVDQGGNVAAASSSGGIWLKHPGRIGPVATYGAGCWAQNERSDDKPGVAAVASGCGEDLMQTLLAKTCSDAIRSPDNFSECLLRGFQTDFLESDFLRNKTEKLGGVLAVRYTQPHGKEVEFGWIHSTNNFCFAFIGGDQKKPTAVMSSLGEQCVPGKSFTMGGHLISLKGNDPDVD